MVTMDERELNGKAAMGFRLLEEGDAFAETDGRRVAWKGESLVLSVPGCPPYTIALDPEPEIRAAWGEGSTFFVRVGRQTIDGRPPQRIFHTMHIDVAARRVRQSADAKYPSDGVVTLFKAAMRFSGTERHDLAVQLRMSFETKPIKRMQALMGAMETRLGDVLEAAKQLPHHEQHDLAERLIESRDLSIHDVIGWGLEDTTVVPDEIVATPDAFVAVEKPSDRARWETNWGWPSWKVVSGVDGVAFAVTGDREPKTGPALPFPRSKQHQGWRHVLELPDGFLVGRDGGEWGGSLDFLARDGTWVATLAKTNTHGIVQVADHIISLHGCNHLSLREGSVRFWTRARHQFLLAGEHELDGGPECFTVSNDRLWVLTAEGLWKIDGRNVERAHAVDVVPFSPTSLVIDGAGDIWAGMRHFVLHFKRRGDGFDEEWLVKKDAEPPPSWPTYSADEID